MSKLQERQSDYYDRNKQTNTWQLVCCQCKGTENLAGDKAIRVLLRVAQTDRMVCNVCYGIVVAKHYNKRPKVKSFEPKEKTNE